MKQTAVEFISKGLFDILQEAENNNILEIGTQNFKRYIEMFEKQAKEMEKEQSLKMLPYDLDELADEHANQFMDGKDHFYGFKAGFQKALELLTFKPE